MRTAVEDADAVGKSECWCCGTIEDPARMVRLGNHPEVALCLGCARWVHLQGREIEDLHKTGVAVRARDQLRVARRKVIERGWHRSRFIGTPLRWLGRRFP